MRWKRTSDYPPRWVVDDTPDLSEAEYYIADARNTPKTIERHNNGSCRLKTGGVYTWRHINEMEHE